MINVTRSFLPDKAIFQQYLDEIWERGHLTNHGPLVLELEKKLKNYLGVKHFFFLNNGTIALQIAIKALALKGEIITTPFSYVATTSSILWEGCEPVFADISAESLTIDASRIEEKITGKTVAIMATHVYGIPCQVEKIQEIADKHGLKVIYDAAHAFGVNYNGTSVLNYGDVSTLSFHATKLFHTIEGGAITTNDDALAHRISYMRNFGHNGAEAFFGVGINGKASEFNAAMGLCILPHIDDIIASRKQATVHYDMKLANSGLVRPSIPVHTRYNYAYYPVVLPSEALLISVRDALNAANIFPRRYFYPSLNTLEYLTTRDHCPVSEDISARVLCLPLFYNIDTAIIDQICTIILQQIQLSCIPSGLQALAEE